MKHRFELGKTFDLHNDIITQYNISGKESNIVVFVNGHYIPKYSKIIDDENIFELDSISNLKKNNSKEFYKYFDKSGASKTNVFTAMNTAFAQDGVYIKIKKNSTLKYPVHVFHFSDGNHSKVTSLMRNLIISETGAKAHILFSFHPVYTDFIYSNIVTEIYTKENSYIDFNVFQGEGDEAFQTNLTKVIQKSGSHFYSNTFTMCGQLVRNDINVDINGENCYTELNGLYMPDKKQHVDNTIYVNHKVGYSNSNQFYRGVLDDKATAVFFGTSNIYKNAVKTDIIQTNNNILLSKYAKIHSKPQLIIHNDDVSAAHGSTVGQLDKEAMFYLRSRGISVENARLLLLISFAEEVVEKVQIEQLKLYYKYLIEKRLSGDKVELQCGRTGECKGCEV